jgi:hypothetical protein
MGSGWPGGEAGFAVKTFTAKAAKKAAKIAKKN